MSSQRAARKRQAIDGVLLLDKPIGITSQAAVSRAKMLLNAAKAGHTGTLDPMATGLLPIAFGEATKFSQSLLDADKRYFATVLLGVTTSTGDLEGEVIARAPVAVDEVLVESALAQFRGEIEQTPPMYSALKHAGKPLYEYARAGTEIARASRRITIRSLTLETRDGDELRIDVTCSKGTYIRVLAEDVGKALGCGACLSALRRSRVAGFTVDDALTLDALAGLTEGALRARLLPIDVLVGGLAAVALDQAQAQRLCLGQAVEYGRPLDEGLVRVYGPDAHFLGIAQATRPALLSPRRLVAAKAQNG